MPRVTKKSVTKSPLYLEHVRSKDAVGEQRDCTVRALSAACDVSYETARDLLAQLGRRPGKGSNQMLTAVARLGYTTSYVSQSHFTSRYPGNHKNKRFVTTHHPDRFPKVWGDGETYLFMTRGHVLCVRNGINHDWTRGTSHKVLAIYRVRKA